MSVTSSTETAPTSARRLKRGLRAVADLYRRSLLSRHERAMAKDLVLEGNERVLGLVQRLQKEIDWGLLQALRDDTAELSYNHFVRVCQGDDEAAPLPEPIPPQGEFLTLKVVLDGIGVGRQGVLYDLACGAGTTLFNMCFVHDFASAVGVSASRALVDAARERAFLLDGSARRALGLEGLTVDFRVGTFASVDWADATAAIVDTSAMSDEDLAALADCASRLAPGSVLICVGRPCLHDALSTCFSGRARMRTAVQSVFAMRRVQPDGTSPGTPRRSGAADSPAPGVATGAAADDDFARTASLAASAGHGVLGVAGAAGRDAESPGPLRLPRRVLQRQQSGRALRQQAAAAAAAAAAPSAPAAGGAAAAAASSRSDSPSSPPASRATPAIERLVGDAQPVRAGTPMAVWKRLAAVRSDVGMPPSSPQGSALNNRKQVRGEQMAAAHRARRRAREDGDGSGDEGTAARGHEGRDAEARTDEDDDDDDDDEDDDDEEASGNVLRLVSGDLYGAPQHEVSPHARAHPVRPAAAHTTHTAAVHTAAAPGKSRRAARPSWTSVQSQDGSGSDRGGVSPADFAHRGGRLASGNARLAQLRSEAGTPSRAAGTAPSSPLDAKLLKRKQRGGQH